ncbi:hypothetical protein COV81_01010 [Candidatus Peregrinibacteria bacterium CG11_big_fil_rev_8_21_14_0_20_41_10]|nr:MAG: hypothetical protein COV81_01010 [Candidatus Peregrinibacteria bacterium CG11_big_fil_rev_8_21_14_0_20_41_10]PIZ74592.1 MAG: hypothetical protein COY06_03975 [Candidatus Peregrinibacteria bacterium CG_4_10_14_0_2_um_filter_41_8]PJC38123.1 MAG: hypothetical protein CO045_01945 [Candidatus Peregrinibacteria bacterium CG_4_9_14_0_2_um_filter_41_14]
MKNTHLFWYLRNVDLFQGLSESDLRDVAAIVHERSCHKRELLYSPYEGPNDIFILKKGEITLYTSKGGRRLVLDILGPSSIFGCLTPDLKSAAHFAEVTETAYICTISLQKFSKLIGEKPQILMNLLNILAGQVREYQARLQESAMNAEEKVLACLKQQKTRNSSILAQWFNSGKLTHEKIAEQTGLARETVSRIMSRLKKEGKL